MSRIGSIVCCALILASAAEARDASPGSLALDIHAGDRLEAVLAALIAQGHRIVYSSALVRPDMRLRTVPSSSGIEALLGEILAPWNLRAVHAENGDWLIAPGNAPARAPISETTNESIETIDVTGSRLQLAVPGASQAFLDRKDVERMPHLADDAMRMLKVLPGVTGGDFSAALNIRGGRRDEALFTIDGAEIHNAFHFRDIDGALSVLDTSLVEGIDFVSGGMTADVGDYMSGYAGLQTHRPSPEDEYRSGVGISFVSAYGRSSGTFAQDRGWWLASIRRGFLDVLTERVQPDDEQLTPRYTDVFAATGYDFTERTSFEAHFLLSDDDLRFSSLDDEDIQSAGKGHSQHLWFTLEHAFSDTLRSETLLSMTTAEQTRDAGGTDDHRESAVHSDEEFRYFDVRQDWSWTLGDTQLPRWGINFGQQHADYDYAMSSTITDPLASPVPIVRAYATDLSPEMSKIGAYAAWRSRLSGRITAEAGVRWDQYRYDGGLDFDAVSPRLNLVYAFDAGELRAAWGVNYQPQSINELQVEDDVEQFFDPERVQQWVLGYTHRFAAGISARIDVYGKNYSHLRPRFENALDPIQLVPEGALDRVRIDAAEARAKGVELTLRREAERGFAGWVSVALARAEDFEDGDWRPRSWEQRETLTFGVSWTGVKWNVSLAGLLHNGTPTTPIGIASEPLPGGGYEVQGVVGEHNSGRLGAYSRVDLRANRDVILENSKLSFYIEVTNMLDSKNQCCVEDYHVADGRPAPVLVIDKSYWLPMLPSFGFQWEF